MATKTHIDQLIDYKEEIIGKLMSDQMIMGLVFDDPTVDLDGDQVANVRATNLFDHSYSDNTVQTDKVLILVETGLLSVLSKEVNTFEVQIQVICARNYMKLDGRKFKGLRGNRRDNVLRYIAQCLFEARLGLGVLKLVDCGPVDVPKGFTSMRLVFQTDDFSKNRRIRGVSTG